MKARRAVAALFTLFVPALVACGGGSGSVVRVVHGRQVAGRFVSEQAYAAFARGALLEARGDLQAAESAYGQALEDDTRSAEIWTRLGALRCQIGSSDAEDAFERAAQIDENYEPLWRERAHCHLRRGETRAGLGAATRAFSIDPDREATSLLMATLLERVGRLDDAERWLQALVARDPTSLSGWTALHELAEKRGDHLRREWAAIELVRLSRVRHAAAPLAKYQDRLAAVDRALLESTLARARQLAIDAHLPPGALALRAAALGRAGHAREQSTWVLAADSRNTDAWIARLVSADLERDDGGFELALRSLGDQPVEPGTLAVRLLAELLARRAGEQAAVAWLRAFGPLPEPADALEQNVAHRLKPLLDRPAP